MSVGEHQGFVLSPFLLLAYDLTADSKNRMCLVAVKNMLNLLRCILFRQLFKLIFIHCFYLLFECCASFICFLYILFYPHTREYVIFINIAT